MKTRPRLKQKPLLIHNLLAYEKIGFWTFSSSETENFDRVTLNEENFEGKNKKGRGSQILESVNTRVLFWGSKFVWF